MKLKFYSVFLALLLGACAGSSPFATSYGRDNLIDTGGYKEKEVEPGVWRVQGRANAVVRRGFARDIAIYRAAELMREQGFEHFQIIDQKGQAQSVGFGGASMSYAGETQRLWVVGLSDGKEPLACRAENKNACTELTVDTVLATLAGSLGIERSEADTEF